VIQAATGRLPPSLWALSFQTARMQEVRLHRRGVELRREQQQSRTPTVGALGAASAPRQLLLRCSTSCIRSVVRTLNTYLHVGNAGAVAEAAQKKVSRLRGDPPDSSKVRIPDGIPW
jgi:hypothetical protein